MVSWATWLPFTGVPGRCVVLCVRCPGPLGSCSSLCPLDALCCVCGFLGHLAPVHQCARSVLCSACGVSWATWLLFAGVPALCVAWRVPCPGPLGCRSLVCPRGVLCCVVCAVSRATRLLFTGVPARCVVLRVRRPGPLDSCSPVCPLCPLLCLCGVLGIVSPVHRCARPVICFACALSSATFLLFTGVPARCLVLPVRCPGPLDSCSLVCALGALLGVCGVLGHLAAVHRCAHAVCCVVCAVSWATWLLFTGVLACCVVLLVRRPGPLGPRPPVRPLGVLCCLCGVLGPLAPVHRCARSVSCVACAVSWATWLPCTGVLARRVVLRVRCAGPPGSCPPVCLRDLLYCLCGVLGRLAPVHWCARSVYYVLHISFKKIII